MVDILISSRVFVPADQIDRDLLTNYEIPQYKEEGCSRCPIYKEGERHSSDCDSCPNFSGITQLWQEKRFKGQDYIALPPGRIKRLERIFDLDISKAVDLRPEIPFKSKLKFTGELYHGQVINKRKTVDQVAVVADWLRRKTGIIEVPPRGGKTVIATYAVCELGLRTLIVTHEGRLLKQFRRAFRGNHKYPAFTNVRKLEAKSGKSIVKIIDKLTDFTDDVDVALITYQKFIRATGSARIRKYINNHFSFLIVDEAHMGGAAKYIDFIAKLNCRYRMALSAKIDRKDGQSYVVKEYLGNTVARSEVTALIPEIELVETSVGTAYNYKSWPYAMQFLANHQAREKLILRETFQDLQAGHVIIIPVDFVKHGQRLTDLINKQARYRRKMQGEKWPQETAVFYSNQIRNPNDLQKILGRVDRGRHKVLIAIRSKIKMGIDLALPTMLYCVVPMSASARVNSKGMPIGAPMFYQLSHRISTWVKGKRQPKVKLFIDNIPQSVGCFKSLFWKEIWPNLRPLGKRSAHYKMTADNITRAMQISRMSEYLPPGKPGERITTEQIIKSAKGKITKRPIGFIGLRR